MFQTRMAMLAILVALGGNAVAATFCVNSGAELRSALASAQNNGESDEILVASGIHEVDSGSTAFAYSTSQDFAVSIIGGYNATCTIRTDIASFTILDGEDQRQVLALTGSANSDGYIGVFNVLIRNGYSDQFGAGLEAGGPTGFSGTVNVNNVIFLENISTTAVGGLSISNPAGRISVLGNLFINNGCSWDYCAFDLLSNAPATALHPIPVLFGNNTVVESVCINGAPASCDVSGGRFYGDANAAFFNNVFVFNEDADLRLQGSNVDLDHNNLLTWIGTPASQSGNLAYTDPLFGGPGNYRLSSASPLRNAGVIGAYPFGALDLDGNQRIYGPEVDIGAYENTVAIFGNGFETPF